MLREAHVRRSCAPCGEWQSFSLHYAAAQLLHRSHGFIRSGRSVEAIHIFYQGFGDKIQRGLQDKAVQCEAMHILYQGSGEDKTQSGLQENAALPSRAGDRRSDLRLIDRSLLPAAHRFLRGRKCWWDHVGNEKHKLESMSDRPLDRFVDAYSDVNVYRPNVFPRAKGNGTGIER